MLRTRIWMGSLLTGLTLGMLFLDDRLAPWYPFLFAFFALTGSLGCWELLGLLPPERRPSFVLSQLGVLAIVAGNWIRPAHDRWPQVAPWSEPWLLIAGLLAAVMLAAFLREMAAFQGPCDSIARVSATLFSVAYLGVLASFLAQLRWLPRAEQATNALMLAIFVPKCCDIGAYCSGRLFGRHQMTPQLSPKKTWEGAAGGLWAAIVTAVGVSVYGARPEYFAVKAVAFGALVGILGMFGDLAESLLKREGQKKDASQAVPGFGGVLDVIDSVLFTAPLSFVWLTTTSLSPLG